jgi:hypothetical protein
MKAKKMSCGSKSKGYAKGGAVKPMAKDMACEKKGMASGGMARGCGAATKGKMHSKKMG